MPRSGKYSFAAYVTASKPRYTMQLVYAEAKTEEAARKEVVEKFLSRSEKFENPSIHEIMPIAEYLRRVDQADAMNRYLNC